MLSIAHPRTLISRRWRARRTLAWARWWRWHRSKRLRAAGASSHSRLPLLRSGDPAYLERSYQKHGARRYGGAHAGIWLQHHIRRSNRSMTCKGWQRGRAGISAFVRT